ncbi:hypothetical protein D8674_025405 [Pyrus ussuriensis x Pyrus communis]|uniref:Uncharacterized protein n=1 Tax=Pyrus ussuriensis x Pyrus communis TaxID=2448454 RepID=A0A5N5H9H1_9ROSA|nr:hypothetical protein D8674_025405 [Pyrus ussuriensis x Pyrus communis]
MSKSLHQEGVHGIVGVKPLSHGGNFKKHINNAQGGAKASVATVNTKDSSIASAQHDHASRTAEASAFQKSSRTFPKAPTSQRSSGTVPKLPVANFPVHMPLIQLTLLFPVPLQDTGLP